MRTVTAVGNPESENVLAMSGLQRRLDDWSVKPVELNQKAFVLSLAWTISGSTHAIVSLQMGYPELCRTTDAKVDDDGKGARADPKGDAQNLFISVPTVAANSCVMDAVLKLVDPRRGAPNPGPGSAGK
jgi:hypothetical protein